MALATLTSADPLQLGRFTILARLGGGGMGIVYLAEDEEGVVAAVKVVKGELAEDPDFRARFRREVEAGRRVSGRCAARYLDADVLARSPWLATEFVPGPTLHAEIHRNGPMPYTRLAGLAAGLADALVAIHRAGLVHRDLKPANVLLAPDGPKVIDFGIALASDTTILTSTGVLVGSPSYMSPEQARGSLVGPEADVFAWGCCVVFAATGEPPFGEGQAAGVLYKVVNDPPNLGDLALDPVLAPLVSKALSKDPKDRPSPVDLFHALQNVLLPSATPPIPGPPPLPPPAPGVPVDGALIGAEAAEPVEPPPIPVMHPDSPVDATEVLKRTWVAPTDVVASETLLTEARELRLALPPSKVRLRAEAQRKRNRRNAVIFGVACLAAAILAFFVIDPFGSEERGLAAGSRYDADTTTTTGLAGIAPVPGATSTSVGAGTPGEGGATTTPGASVAGTPGTGTGGGDTTVATGSSGVVGPNGQAPITIATTTTKPTGPTTTLSPGVTTSAPTTSAPLPDIDCGVTATNTKGGAPKFGESYIVNVTFNRNPGFAWTAQAVWFKNATSADRAFSGSGQTGSQTYALRTGNTSGGGTPSGQRRHAEDRDRTINISVFQTGGEVAICETSFRTPS